MRTRSAAPVGGTTGHGKINGSAESIAACEVCGYPKVEGVRGRWLCEQCREGARLVHAVLGYREFLRRGKHGS